eukprot:TRINITY_DN27521_c0_g1_i1.p1 TRINITY_DN27521_c0_g1~~TRINITY_DN27521_c0_g1_i1.p1  ORF type:complete len:563 (+),score=118.06 TRINITY_DN27521_c0_g1_i1:70-1758(+)
MRNPISRRGGAKLLLFGSVAGYLLFDRQRRRSSHAFVAGPGRSQRLPGPTREERDSDIHSSLLPRLCSPGEATQDDADMFRVARRGVRSFVWDKRREFAGGAIGAAKFFSGLRVGDALQEEERERERRFRLIRGEDPDAPKAESDPFVTLSVVVVICAILFRVGGRALFMSFMGLDMIQDPELQANLNNVLAMTDSYDFLAKFLGVLLAWCAAKVVMLDFLLFPLAVANGIIFGGVVQGMLVSCSCGTIASSLSFFISRTFLAPNAQAQVDTSPGLRALEKAVTGQGARSVFTLRLAPILPIPIGGYAYLFGLTRIAWSDFALGTFTGSAKVYFLDAYLGSMFKDMSQPTAASQPSDIGDIVLFTTFVATIAAGTFAQELAVKSFGELTSEIKTFDKTLAEKQNYEDGDPRNDDPLLSKPSTIDSLAFWGLKVETLPEFPASVIKTLNKAQAQIRNVYADAWLQVKRDTGAAASASQVVAVSSSSQPATAAAGAEDDDSSQWLLARPQDAEAVTGWKPDWGLEFAQELVSLPVVFDAIGAYSAPQLWPGVMEDARKNFKPNS